ncbi:MAG: PAS domain S-box protein [Proteobacteria bacterium]|nr:PAS domain S-box protein [Pseudomonadota bacterium]MBU1688948.1 PAS domain S-box protein [Pseudomonadota bacterium]
MSPSDIELNTSQGLLLRDLKKRRRIWLVILICLCTLPILTYIESRVFELGTIPFPVSGNVLVFTVINLNVMLLLLVVFLVLRNLVQLIFERRRDLLGTRLRTKMVVSFVSLSLVPTGLLFFISLQFVSTSMDYWFNIRVEQSLQESLNMAREVYDKARSQVRSQGKSIAVRLEAQLYQQLIAQHLDLFLTDIAESHGLAGLELLSNQRVPLVKVFGTGIDRENVPEVPAELLRRALAGETDLVAIQTVEEGELVRGLTPVNIGSLTDQKMNILITSLLLPRSRLRSMELISSGLEGYRQLMLLKNPIKTSLLVVLLVVTLLIIFSAIWFGFYMARGLTGPIATLASATRRVADGELDFVLDKDSDDEMGTLVDSFNQMTRDLLAGKLQLEKVNQALTDSNLELSNRQQYTETILQNVAAGVVSMDETGRITTINRFAEELLKIDRDRFIGKDYREMMRPEHQQIMSGFFEELISSGRSTIQHPVRLNMGDEIFSLRVNFTQLRDEQNRNLGVVLVFDNLTELEKAQRMAAWREVARRIAHEVKNPLTPIQLSAQRLRKRYLEKLADDGEVFDNCTQTIVNQVDELKRLVSEFSNFARMPAVQKANHSLFEMARELYLFFGEAHKNIDFKFNQSGEIPKFPFDLKQLKRVMINLLDNAVAAVDPQKGQIGIDLRYDEKNRQAFLEVWDNGPGVADNEKLRLFEPYFSTKKSGTGLGLAIASTIVADHDGYIRVRDNEPSGARFVVELPVQGK